jgi:hypothetical protein
MQRVSTSGMEYQEILILEEATSAKSVIDFISHALDDLYVTRKSLLKTLKTPLCVE